MAVGRRSRPLVSCLLMSPYWLSVHAGPAAPPGARRGGYLVGGGRSSPPSPFLWRKASFWHKAFSFPVHMYRRQYRSHCNPFRAYKQDDAHRTVPSDFRGRGRSRVRGKGEALSLKPRGSFPFCLPVLHPLTAWRCNPLHACMPDACISFATAAAAVTPCCVEQATLLHGWYSRRVLQHT